MPATLEPPITATYKPMAQSAPEGLYRFTPEEFRKVMAVVRAPANLELKDGLLFEKHFDADRHLVEAPEGIYRFTSEEYYRLEPILRAPARVELLDGLVLEKFVKGIPHDAAVRALTNLLPRLLPATHCFQCECTLGLSHGEPEPDFVVLRGDYREFATRRPGPTDATIVIEVAHSSLRRDRGGKLTVYAKERIACYWIINLIEGVIEVYSDPQGDDRDATYATRTEYRAGDEVPVVIDGVTVGTIPVSDLLP